MFDRQGKEPIEGGLVQIDGHDPAQARGKQVCRDPSANRLSVGNPSVLPRIAEIRIGFMVSSSLPRLS